MTNTNADTLDAEVRRAEPDLWLSSRLVADPAVRASLVALYALNVELAKVADAASNPLAGEIRLAWWSEEVDALCAGNRAFGHPALQALATAPPDAVALHTMIESRHAELEAKPFQDETALVAYLSGVDGALMRAAVSLLAPGAVYPLTETTRAWGWARLLRQRPAWRLRHRDWTPVSWGETQDDEINEHVRHLVLDAVKVARNEVSGLPVAAFPAVAHLALCANYARGRDLSDLEKRWRLLWASVRGRV